MWNNWEQLWCVAHSTLIVDMTIALLFSLGMCIVQMQSVRVNFACTKILSNISAEAIIIVRNACVCARCAIFLLKFKKFLFVVACAGGLYFEEIPKSIQDVIGDLYCPGNYCFNTEKCQSLDCYVITPRSTYGCGKCRAWLFVHKVLFTLQEHVKTTKTDKTRFLC